MNFYFDAKPGDRDYDSYILVGNNIELFSNDFSATFKDMLSRKELKGSHSESASAVFQGKILNYFGTAESPFGDVLGLRHRLADAMNVVRSLKSENVYVEIRTDLLSDEVRNLQSELGALLSGYKYDEFKKSDDPEKEINLYVGYGKHEESSVLASALAESIILGRDLVNGPPCLVTPSYMEKTARDIAESGNLSVTVFDEPEFAKKGFNLISAVSAGSSENAKLIQLTYEPEGEVKKTIAFVGKGLTFDAGGLSIKPGAAMVDMKCDMGGGAAVLGAMKAVSLLKPKGIKVLGVVPSSENLLGASAMKVGDIFRSYNGKTVEVLNTDAEGRLILADALTYTAEQNPDLIIDLATLTGACMVALGDYTIGAFTNQQDKLDELLAASKEVGEDVWQLPLNPALKPLLKSEIADLKNIGGKFGGSITAALFLSEFVNDKPWIHLDIAGPAFLDKGKGSWKKGGTGAGITSLVGFIKKLEKNLK